MKVGHGGGIVLDWAAHLEWGGWFRRPEESSPYAFRYSWRAARGNAACQWCEAERILHHLLSVFPLEETGLALDEICDRSNEIAGIAIVRLQNSVQSYIVLCSAADLLDHCVFLRHDHRCVKDCSICKCCTICSPPLRQFNI